MVVKRTAVLVRSVILERSVVLRKNLILERSVVLKRRTILERSAILEEVRQKQIQGLSTKGHSYHAVCGRLLRGEWLNRFDFGKVLLAACI